MKRPVVLAFVCAMLAIAFCLAVLWPLQHGGDLTWPLRGARQLLAGENPYKDPSIGPGRPYPDDAVLYYPLPALLIVLPLTPFPDPVAAALFGGISVISLILVHYKHPALIGMLCSAPLLSSLYSAQWGPLLTAAAGLPLLGFMLTAKPSLGGMIWLNQPNRRAFYSIAAIAILSLLIWPTWPIDWLENVSKGRHVAPIVTLPLLALGLLRFRDPRFRLIVLLSLAPQFAGGLYDHLPVWLVVRDRRQGLLLAVTSWFALLMDIRFGTEWLLVLSTYGVAMAILWGEVFLEYRAKQQAASPT